MKNILMTCVLIGLASSSYAQDQTGWVAGGSIGTANVKLKSRYNDTATVKDDVTLITAYGGYNFTQWFGLEFDISSTSDVKNSNMSYSSIIGVSVAPKFRLHLNDNITVYAKTGLQYLAYDQPTNGRYRYRNDETLNAANAYLGTGVQYSFASGMRVSLDYKYSEMTLERNNYEDRYYYDNDDVRLTYKAFTVMVGYQF